MTLASDESRSLLASHGTLRRGGLWLRLSAATWMVHPASVIAYGISIPALLGSNYKFGVLLASFAGLVALVMASAAAVALGFGLRSLTSGSSDLISAAPEGSDRDSARLTIPRMAYRSGRIAVLLCFAYAGVGLVALALFVVGSDFPSSFALSDPAFGFAISTLWLLASGILFVIGVYGGDFLERFLSLVVIYDDPFHLVRWYGALTALFANPFLLALGFYGGFFGVFVLAFPFGLCPLLGFAAFRKIYHIGSRLARMNPRGPAPTIESGKSTRPVVRGGR